jgi:hypothetical protein
MATKVEQNLRRPIQVLLLLLRVPDAILSQVNQVCSDLNADVQRPACNISNRLGIRRHYWAPSLIKQPTEVFLAAIRIQTLYFPKKKTERSNPPFYVL